MNTLLSPKLYAAVLFASSTLVAAQTDFAVTSPKLYSWNQSDWSLTTTSFAPGQYQSRISLANGYTGASLAAAGPFFETDTNQTNPDGGIQPINGWPLFDTRIAFSTVSGFFDVQKNGSGTNYPWLEQYGWESFISGIPHPTSIIFAFGDDYLDATVKNTSISNFASKISFKTGVGEWSYTWTPEGAAASFNVSFAAFFSRARPNVVAVQSIIIPSADINGTVTDLLDGGSAVRSYLDAKGINGSTIYSSVHPDNLSNITATVVSGVNLSNQYADSSSGVLAGAGNSTNDTSIGQTWNISLKQGEAATFYKYVGIASNDKFLDEASVARDAQAAAQQDGWEALLAEHIAAWAEIMPEESVDDFTDPITGELPEDENVLVLHIASVANTYYLLQNMQPDGSGLNDNSISVGGLVSDSYAGLVFWDADYWMSPGLNLAFPNWAKQISNFRIKQHQQALDNAAFNGYPNGSALYSWTTGRYGNCTGTGPCVDYEYHLNYDIAFNLFQQYNVTKNDTWFDNGPRQIIDSVAVMTGHLLNYNETTQTWWLRNATDPDEYANNVDNPAFTIASAAELLRLANNLRVEQGLSANSTWTAQSENIAFPTAASNITLEYQTMNNSVAVKQADVVLLTYPLDFKSNGYDAEKKILDLDYYANKQSPNGPAMTYSIFAVDANTLSLSGCSAYTYTLNGFLPYLRAPFFQFSEQAVDDTATNGNTNPAFPFLTGHGGANQVVPFGFLGVRTDQPTLYVNPSLPPQISNVRVRIFYFAGATLMASMNTTHTNLTRISTSASVNLIDAYANTSMPIMVGTPGSTSTKISLMEGQSIIIPNRLYFQTNTYANNLLQCLPATSEDAYAAGQFPIAAIDGASATRWQPATNESSSLLVNMTSVPPSRVSSIYFDFGARPPKNVIVYLGNITDGEIIYGLETIIEVDGIQPSLPFDEAAAEMSTQMVEPVQSNTTTVVIAGGSWSGSYMRLVIEGCWEEDGVGATVGEVALVAEN